MNRDIHSIDADITVQRQRIAAAQQILASLEHERTESQALENADARQRQLMARVLSRYEQGEALLSTPRVWWHRDGQLIEQATRDEIDAMLALRNQGLLEPETVWSRRELAA